MIVVEYGTEDYGKIMEYIDCIEKKAKKVKEIIADDTMDQRYRMRYRKDDEDDDEEEDYKYHTKKRMSRYA